MTFFNARVVYAETHNSTYFWANGGHFEKYDYLLEQHKISCGGPHQNDEILTVSYGDDSGYEDYFTNPVPVMEGATFLGYTNNSMFDTMDPKVWDGIYKYQHGIEDEIVWDVRKCSYNVIYTSWWYDSGTITYTLNTKTGEITYRALSNGRRITENLADILKRATEYKSQNKRNAYGNYALWSKPLGFNITFNVNGGSTTISSQTVSSITLPNPGTRVGYTFAGWYNGNTRIGGVGDKWTPTSNTTLTAHWTARTDTKYTVKHYQMNLDGKNYTLVATDNLKGTTDTKVTPARKSYTGFTAPSGQTVNIDGNGSRVVNYYYSRNKYQFTLGSHQGINTSGSTGSGSYYYGASIKLKASPKNGYTWAKWSDYNTSASRTFSMPANALTITPSANLITYNIKYVLYGGTVTPIDANPTSYTVESPDIKLTNPNVFTNKTFIGWSDWNTDIPKTTYIIPTGSTGDLIISANWKPANLSSFGDKMTGSSNVTSNKFTIS